MYSPGVLLRNKRYGRHRNVVTPSNDNILRFTVNCSNSINRMMVVLRADPAEKVIEQVDRSHAAQVYELEADV